MIIWVFMKKKISGILSVWWKGREGDCACGFGGRV